MKTDHTESQFTHIAITDSFWMQYQKLITEVVIPYQWCALNDTIDDAEPSHAIDNFKIAAGQMQGEFYGMIFQDSDVAKWLEAVAYSLSNHPDPQLESIADDVIDLIGKAQQPNGYVNTYFTVKAPSEKWTNVCECHELYCAGHLIEAGVAYYCATEKTRLLDIVCKFADHINEVFGKKPGQLLGYPGHPEIEQALMRLYEVTQDTRYSQLSQFFIEQRGQQPHYYDIEYERRGQTSYWQTHGSAWMIKDKNYSQAHAPITKQSTATGHAVRFVYLMAGVAHLARINHSQEKLTACRTLWQNVTNKQMYITGSIGSQSQGEAFSCDYDLPNDTAYTETCASIGLIMFANQMLQLDPNSNYADVMERALYNTVLAGIALDGKHFFYVNPLEVYPKAIAYNHIYEHVKPIRQQWFGCACCPPNLARLIGSIGNYIYTVKDNTIYTNLYIASESTLYLSDGNMTLLQKGNYPWQDTITFTVKMAQPCQADIALRVPNWCQQPQLSINQTGFAAENIASDGYIHIKRQWQNDDEIILQLPMQPILVRPNPLLRHDMRKVAIQRGPLVYCIEQADNGEELHNLLLDSSSELKCIAGSGIFAGKTLIKATAYRIDSIHAHSQPLYSFNSEKPAMTKCELTLVPYFSWANRGEGEMRVWINEL
ncbi:glycoside hydrolase family 127 protein [Celerinatantimonas diazotrophica]|uniref:Glycoside hydrolase family 127 protein n=1 Tax=Celerinatantimonas diazotrophica TaxID=412034 RepID=A0A4R1JAP4_9GAMM|nr:beta-L-arabinofuranosidase domain-containing protein [Celerinatantimonas diazotrophica]TCK47574.1 hypothetical protein EV690_2610 [Celerinatantimonas diazotrophica]CAG9296803.1 Non-reducing end beta-L-arabinofuranosidase [Celerinatantimonas diazotrophica]